MNQLNSTLDLTLDTSCVEQHLTPHVDKAVSVIGLVEKERKLYKNQAKDYKRRIQELEAQLAETEREARETQAKMKKKISEITESRNAIREQLASNLLTQEALQKDRNELRGTIMKLQSRTTSIWRNIPDLLKRTAKNSEEGECEHESSVKVEDLTMDASDQSNDEEPPADGTMEGSMIYYSPAAR